MRLFALVLLFCASGMALAQKASNSAGKPPAATYDPILAYELSIEEWVKIYPTIPQDKISSAEVDHLLQRRKGESDQAYSYRFYARYDTEKNLSRAKQMYAVLQKHGRGDSHRWLYITEAKDLMNFVDVRTATGGDQPAAWFQVLKFGVPDSNEYWLFDCSGRRSQLKTYVTFNKDGSVKDSGSDSATWDHIPPGSVAEAKLDFMCS